MAEYVGIIAKLPFNCESLVVLALRHAPIHFHAPPTNAAGRRRRRRRVVQISGNLRGYSLHRNESLSAGQPSGIIERRGSPGRCFSFLPHNPLAVAVVAFERMENPQKPRFSPADEFALDDLVLVLATRRGHVAKVAKVTSPQGDDDDEELRGALNGVQALTSLARQGAKGTSVDALTNRHLSWSTGEWLEEVRVVLAELRGGLLCAEVLEGGREALREGARRNPRGTWSFEYARATQTWSLWFNR